MASTQTHGRRGLFVAGLVALLATALVSAQTAEVVVTVQDKTVCAAVEQDTIDILLSTQVDSIAGVNLWLQMDRPDVIQFQIGTDTVFDTAYWYCSAWYGDSCGDSIMVGPYDPWDWISISTLLISPAAIDTTGSLISGWEFVEARSLSGHETDLLMVGIADMPGGDFVPGIAAGEDGVLYRVPVTVSGNPGDSVNILIQHDFVSHFGLARPDGTTIGLTWEYGVDTACWQCVVWVDTICVNWQRVLTPPPEGCDSMEIVPDSTPVIDTNVVQINSGWLVLVDPAFGDFNGDGAITDIADLIYLVSYMFQNGPPVACIEAADCVADGEINIADLVCWVSFMFPPQ